MPGPGGATLSCELWREEGNRRITVQVSQGNNQDPISKITRAKKTGSMAQAVEHLPKKHKALSLNSSDANK
jgi:hypothetical protein